MSCVVFTDISLWEFGEIQAVCLLQLQAASQLKIHVPGSFGASMLRTWSGERGQQSHCDANVEGGNDSEKKRRPKEASPSFSITALNRFG